MPRLQKDGYIDSAGEMGGTPLVWSTEGDFTVGGVLTATGAQTLTGNTTMSGNATVSGTLGVTGATTMTGAANADGGLDRSTAAALSIGPTNATSVTIGKAGASAGNGVRHAASRYIDANKPTAPVDIAGGITATVTQLLEAGIFLCSASATLTLPTAQGASGIVQALPGTPAVGDIISFVQVVAAAQTATLAAGTGSTLVGIATTAAAATGRRWIGRITSVTANSETISWY